MLLGGRARPRTTTWPCERANFLRQEAPGHMQDAHQKQSCNGQLSAPCASQAWRTTSAIDGATSASTHLRRATIGRVGNMAQAGMSYMAHAHPQTSLQRPPERPPLRPSVADGGSIACAGTRVESAMRETLPDGARSGASVGQAWFATRGGGEWAAADLHCASDV